MSNVESLENLTNNELRLKCVEYGLPNVPVTDSSRKLLLKRLRDSMLAKDSQGKETGNKSSNRRETIHVSKTTPAAAAAGESVNEPLSLSQPIKTRRTLAGIAPVAAKDDTPPTSIPVSTRRRSVQKESELKPAKLTGAAAAAAAPPNKAMPTIVIEDDEEDHDLITAVENAEKESTTLSLPIETISSRRKSRSVSVPKVTEAPIAKSKRRAMTPLVEEKTVENQRNLTKTAPAPTPAVAMAPAKIVVASSNNNAQRTQKSFVQSAMPSLSQSTPKKPFEIFGNTYGVYDQQQRQYDQQQQHVKLPNSQPLPKIGHENTAGRYSMNTMTSTVYSSPSMRYSIGEFGSNLSSYRSKYTAADILNEQSDTDGHHTDDAIKSPFLSDFARNLERSRSVGRTISGGGTSSGKYMRQSGMSYDPVRGRRAKNEPTFAQLVNGLNRRYKLKPIIILIAICLLSVLGYVCIRSP